MSFMYLFSLLKSFYPCHSVSFDLWIVWWSIFILVACDEYCMPPQSYSPWWLAFLSFFLMQPDDHHCIEMCSFIHDVLFLYFLVFLFLIISFILWYDMIILNEEVYWIGFPLSSAETRWLISILWQYVAYRPYSIFTRTIIFV